MTLGSIYINCEGIRGEEDVFKMRWVKEVISKAKEVISKAKEDGLNIMIGGDMNAHIWELDKCQNKNGENKIQAKKKTARNLEFFL